MFTSLNSFAMIFGHYVWIPPSPKAALAALGLFFFDLVEVPHRAAARQRDSIRDASLCCLRFGTSSASCVF